MSDFYRVGLSSAFELTETNFKGLAEANIRAMEISVPREKYDELNYGELRRLSDAYDVELWSFHLPFNPFTELDPSSADKSIREHTVEYFSELVKRASDIGIDKFVIHASAEPISDEERGERMKYSMQSLDVLAEIAHCCGACIAVEDLPRTCLGKNASEIAQIISANSKLRVCFDTNHLLESDNLGFIDALGDKIITVHISDYDCVNERHWLPGEGVIDWAAMLKKFNEINYKGVWMYEIPLKCPNTIIRDRDLAFADFYENAVNIFTNKKQPVLSRPKENLGFWE